MPRTPGAGNKIPREHMQDAAIATLKATVAKLRAENKALKAVAKAAVAAAKKN